MKKWPMPTLGKETHWVEVATLVEERPPPPNNRISKYSAPKEASPGESITINWTIHNAGGNTGYTSYTLLLDRDTGEELFYREFSLAPSSEENFTYTGKMPDKDWKLTLTTGYIKDRERIETARVDITIMKKPPIPWEWVAIGVAVTGGAVGLGFLIHRLATRR